MPYKSNSELPKSVKVLPNAAQTIFRKIANAAIQQYGDIPEKVMAVAWAGLSKAGWKKDESSGKWHRVKESEAMTPEEESVWLEDTVKEILSELADPPKEVLTEQMEPSYEMPPEVQHRMLGMALQQCSCLLSEYAEVLSESDRGVIASLVSRLANRVAAREAVNLDLIQEAVEQLIIAEALQEAGQRHSNDEYQLFDQVLDMVKRLRGQTPKEAAAERQQQADEEEKRANSPDEQMLQGYRGVAVKESLDLADGAHLMRESVDILQEASTDGSGSAWEVSIIQAGLSKNKRLYPLDVLRQSASLFEGARVYTYDRLLKGKEVFDHLSDAELRANPQGYAKDLVGFLKEARIVGSRLVATLVLLENAAWLRNNLQDAFRHGQPGLYGLSIDAEGDGHLVESGGESILHVDSIRHVRSVDVVTYPAAGGGFLRLVASVAKYESEREIFSVVETLQQQQQRLQVQWVLEEALDEADVPRSVHRRIRAKVMAAVFGV